MRIVEQARPLQSIGCGELGYEILGISVVAKFTLQISRRASSTTTDFRIGK